MPMVCSHFCQLPSHHCVYRLIRTGYGIFYGRTPAITVGTAFSNNALNVQTFNFTGANIPQYPNTKCGTPAPAPS